MKLTLLIIIAAAAAPAFAQQQSLQQATQQVRQQPAQRVSKPQEIDNERMDYSGFLKTAGNVEKLRKERRITEEQFIAMGTEPRTVVLDARSRDKYALRHIKGAVSIPFTDFNEDSLAKVIPYKHTRVLIYCNNNFREDEDSFPMKRAATALNISTFIALAEYGYDNVYELGPLLDVKTAKVQWGGTKAEKQGRDHSTYQR